MTKTLEIELFNPRADDINLRVNKGYYKYMDATTENIIGVREIVNAARKFNQLIGNYQQHFISDRFTYIVKLSNGRLEMSTSIAQDYEILPSCVTDERIKKVAETFL